MTKADLVEAIAVGTGLSKKDTGVVVDLILENISRALCEGDKVELRGFEPRSKRETHTLSTCLVFP